MGSSIKNVICLTLITLVAGFGLGYVYEITKEPIAQMEEKTKLVIIVLMKNVSSILL